MGIARAAACALGLWAGACSPAPEPRFRVACEPEASMAQVACTVRNEGNKASRACFRVRLRNATGAELVTRRTCTSVLGPDRSVRVTPPLEPIGRSDPGALLAGTCAPAGAWACGMEIVETQREMTENIPGEP